MRPKTTKSRLSSREEPSVFYESPRKPFNLGFLGLSKSSIYPRSEDKNGEEQQLLGDNKASQEIELIGLLSSKKPSTNKY